MKKSILFIVLILVFISALLICGINYFLHKDNETIGEVSLSEYEYYVDNFSFKPNHSFEITPITSREDAIEKAISIWEKEYGKNCLVEGQPIDVFYDNSNDCWLLKGALPRNTLGGTPHIIIGSNGRIIAVWHDQ